ncbi:MAG: mannose-1-phosphate guanylyltransferase, partial [Bacteroidales bacterium]|nr:mannose-1-phosphate guanylyltransferase [Bacteroidales bacterium]
MKNNYGIIMAGGVGSRFWPMSQTAHPKQFIDILGVGETFIQQTFRRMAKICPKENIFIVTNEAYRKTVQEQLPSILDTQILGEPSMRNTAPCIAYAVYKIYEKNQDANIVVAPSDHVIMNEDEFVRVVNEGLFQVEKNEWLLTLGIKPSRPDTGYGYIQYSENEAYDENSEIRKVKTFTEKPALDMAISFLKSGDFLWNAGIFIWNIKTIINAFRTHLPEVNGIFEKGLGIYHTPNEPAFIKDSYTICPNISIDYGIMEKAENVYVFASDFGWSDLGTWGSLYDMIDKDSNANAIIGKNVMTYNSNNCVINAPDNKLVVVQGLDGYIVAVKKDSLLICKKEDEQQ